MLDTAGLPLIGAYCPINLTDPSRRAEEIGKIVRWGGLIRRYGGTMAVIGPDEVDRERFDFAVNRNAIVAALHQHTDPGAGNLTAAAADLAAQSKLAFESQGYHFPPTQSASGKKC